MPGNPRKQTLLILFACILIVGGVGFYVYGGGSALDQPEASPGQDQGALIEAPRAQISDDSWQKQFLASTSVAFKAPSQQISAPAPEKLTPIDKLGRDFFTKYVELRNEGLTGDTEAVAYAVEQIISRTDQPSSPKTYSSKDIQIVADSAASTVAYMNMSKAVVNWYYGHRDEAEIAATAFETGDMGMLMEIDPIIREYQDAMQRLARTPVPEKLAEAHISLLDGLAMSLYSAESFRHMDTDPFSGLLGVRYNAMGMVAVGTAYAEMSAKASLTSGS